MLIDETVAILTPENEYDKGKGVFIGRARVIMVAGLFMGGIRLLHRGFVYCIK